MAWGPSLSHPISSLAVESPVEERCEYLQRDYNTARLAGRHRGGASGSDNGGGLCRRSRSRSNASSRVEPFVSKCGSSDGQTTPVRGRTRSQGLAANSAARSPCHGPRGKSHDRVSSRYGASPPENVNDRCTEPEVQSGEPGSPDFRYWFARELTLGDERCGGSQCMDDGYDVVDHDTPMMTSRPLTSGEWMHSCRMLPPHVLNSQELGRTVANPSPFCLLVKKLWQQQHKCLSKLAEGTGVKVSMHRLNSFSQRAGYRSAVALRWVTSASREELAVWDLHAPAGNEVPEDPLCSTDQRNCKR